MNIDFKSAIQNYKFLTYSPYLTFSADKKSFIDRSGKSLERYDCFYELYYLGKTAFSLLEVESEEQFQELCKGYFILLIFLLEVSIDEYKKGRLKFINYDHDPLSDISHYEAVAKDPDIYGLQEFAPSLFTWGFELGEILNRQLPADEVDIFNDVYLASLIHTLIEIDHALCASDIGSSDALTATHEATKSLERAQQIYKRSQIEKKSRSDKARFAANKKHERTRKAKEKIREIWSTGKYSSRDICAEQECSSLDISFSTARKALINTPKPS